MNPSIFLAAALAAGTVLSGCALSVEPFPPPVVGSSIGTVTVNWLVQGRSDPAACAEVGATRMEVVVYDANGRPVARETAWCGDFSLTMPLPEGDYTADATLIDARWNRVTTTKTLRAIDVIPDTDLAINLDFPSGSLLP